MPTDPGLQTELLVPAATTGGSCSVFALSGPAGTLVPPHRRDRHDACVVVVSGEVLVRDEEDERLLGSGSVVWLPRQTACRIELVTASRMLFLALPAGFEEFVGSGAAPLDEDDVAVLLGLAGVSLLPPGWGARRAAAH